MAMYETENEKRAALAIRAAREKQKRMGIGQTHESWAKPPVGSSADRVQQDAASLSPDVKRAADQTLASTRAGLPTKIGDAPEYRPQMAPKRPPIFGMAGDQRPPVEQPQSQMPNPTPMDDRVEDARTKIKQSQYRRAMSGDLQRTLQSSSLADFGGDNTARIAEIRRLQAVNAATQGAIAPVQREMGGSEIQAGRADLQRQLRGLGQGELDKAQGLYKSGTPEDLKAGDAAAAEGGRLQRAADERFAPLGANELSGRVAAQDEARKQQIAMRRMNTIEAEQGRAGYESGLEDQKRAGMLQRQTAMSMLEAAKATAAGAAGMAQAEADPENIKRGLKIKQLQQSAEAARVGAETRNAQRGAALQPFGIDDKFEARVVDNIGTLNEGMSDFVKGRVAGGAFGGPAKVNKALKGLDVDVRNLERAAAEDQSPATQELADSLLNMLPEPGPNGEYDSAMFGGNPLLSTVGTGFVGAAFSAANANERSVAARRMTDIYKRLFKIARPQQVQQAQ